MNPEKRLIGGRKYLIFYLDDNGIPVEKEFATKYIKQHISLTGEYLEEKHGFFSPDGRDMGPHDYQDKIRGCLFGGAIGDALGYPVEFMSDKEILRRYGAEGVHEYTLSGFNREALVSDDTQMALFTANGLLVADTRASLQGDKRKPRETVAEAYQDWLATQEKRYHPATVRTSWILCATELHNQRAPGNTCLTALRQERDRPRHDDFLHPAINDSKGCGGIMRVAPIALNYPNMSLRDVTTEAAQIAAITHGHPLGYLSAAVLAYIIHRIVYPGAYWLPLREIVEEARDMVSEWFHGEEHVSTLKKIINLALELSENAESDAHNIAYIGEGWVAEETLGIALYCALRYQNDFSKGVIAAVNHKGVSDSTGAVTGNILGARLGFRKIEDKWKWDLELFDVILALSDDIFYSRKKEARVYRASEWKEKYVEMQACYNKDYQYFQFVEEPFSGICFRVNVPISYQILNRRAPVTRWEGRPTVCDLYWKEKYDYSEVFDRKLMRKFKTYESVKWMPW